MNSTGISLVPRARMVAVVTAGALAFTTLAAVVAAPAQAAPPANDALAAAQALPASGDVESTTVEATIEDGELDAAEPNCPVADPTVWFAYTATTTGVVKATTRSTPSGPLDIDTVLAVYTSSSPSAPTFASLSEVRCNDDRELNYKSQVTFRVVTGATYFVQVSTWGNEDEGVPDEAPFVLRLEVDPGPPNDNIADATTLTPGVLTATTTNFSTMEPGEPETSSCDLVFDSVWFRWTAPADSMADIEITEDGSISTLNVFASDTPSFGDLTHIGCDPISWVLEGDVTFAAEAGTTYWVQVGDYGLEAYSSSPSDKTIILRTSPALANDDLADATVTSSPSSFHVDTTFATLETGEPSAAVMGCGAIRARTQWFRYTPTASGELDLRAINVDDHGEEPVVFVYSGPATSPTYSALTRIGCNGPGTLAQFKVPVTAGVTYYVQAGTFREKGAYDLGLVSGTTTALDAVLSGGNHVDLTASVTPVSGTATGSVAFYDVNASTTVPVGSAPLTGSQAGVSLSDVGVGDHLYRAVFTPSGSGYDSSTSADQPVTVAPPAVSLVASTTSIRAPRKVRSGKAPSITVTVLRGASPAIGQVTVMLRNKVLGTFGLFGCGATSCPLKVKLPKLHKKTKIIVTYAGDATTLGSSAKATIRIKKE